MKDMRSVYKKIKKNYKNIDIDFNEKKDILIIKKNNLKIEADSDMVELFKNNKSITQYHPKNYNDLFGSISLYLNDSESVKRRVKMDTFKQYLFIAVLSLVFVILTNVVPGKKIDVSNICVVIGIGLILFLFLKFILRKK